MRDREREKECTLIIHRLSQASARHGCVCVVECVRTKEGESLIKGQAFVTRQKRSSQDPESIQF